MAERGGIGGESAEAWPRPVFAATAIGISAAFLLCGYECLRSTSTTLFTDAYGAEQLPVIMALTPPALIAALYLYGRLLSWLGPRRTLLATTLASGFGIAVCYIAIEAGSKPATGVLYLLREIYIVLLIEQYWSFLNSTLGTASAKKLNGPICGVASLGAMLGGYLLGVLSQPLGTETMLLLAAAMCLPAAAASELAYRRCGEPQREGDRQPIPKKPGIGVSPPPDHLGLGLFRAHRMLVFLLLAVVATQVLAAVVDLEFQTTLKHAIPVKDARNAWSGNFYMGLNGAAAFSQFLLAPLLLRVLPLGALHIALPLLNVGACAWMLGAPSLASAGTAYMLFKTLDYSLFRAGKEILYIPFSFDVRYRAKEVIDVFGYRLGKGGASLAITLLQRADVVFTTAAYAWTGIAAAAVWLVMIIPAIREYDGGERVAAGAAPRT